MSKRFRLVSKFNGNNLFIIYDEGGYSTVIAHIVLPADNQLSDNVKTSEEICTILKRRIRQSMC